MEWGRSQLCRPLRLGPGPVPEVTPARRAALIPAVAGLEMRGLVECAATLHHPGGGPLNKGFCREGRVAEEVEGSGGIAQQGCGRFLSGKLRPLSQPRA